VVSFCNLVVSQEVAKREGGNSLFAFSSLMICVLAMLLGFVALLRQKTYLDPKTNAPIEIELPLVGRMKANYPALTFIFVAAFFGFLAYSSQEIQPNQWSVTGSVGYADGTQLKQADWAALRITIDPVLYESTVNKRSAGHFTIAPALPAQTTFEDQINQITFILEGPTYLSCAFIPRQELDNWRDPSTRDKSLIRAMTQYSRALNGVKLNKFDSRDPQC